MTAPNMAAITASLERSLQNCSLNHHQHQSRGFLRRHEGERSSSSEISSQGQGQNHSLPTSDTTLELNSHLSLPYHWEQCLDLETGEIYYINWRNGMKAKEDPRLTATTTTTEEEEEEEYTFESEDESSYDSEESSSEYSSPSPLPSSSSRDYRQQKQKKKEEQEVLVVAGCKSCLMYFMVPKQVEDCPKCNGQLLHFDRSENASSP
ncbi:hypothetical protein M5689_008579 [Euphorbia peplus]|nr:hypothetical protein M5689_008579 [Euphorbia peplus]